MEFKILEKSLNESNVFDASNFLAELYIDSPQRFKKRLLLNASLPEPIIEKFSEEKLFTLINSFMNAAKIIEDQDVDLLLFSNDAYQIIKSIKVLNKNRISVSKKLEDNSFLEYTLSQQVQMCCIFLEHQIRMVSEQGNYEKNFLTGLENQVAKYEVGDTKDVKISKTDNLEALIEVFDTLFKYLYHKNRKPKDENSFAHENVSPYEANGLREIIKLSSQHNSLMSTWEKFKYREWIFKEIKDGETKINLFEPANKAEYLKERIALDRYTYYDHINVQTNNINYEVENLGSLKHMERIVEEIDNPDRVFSIDKQLFHYSKHIVKNTMNAQLISLDKVYLDLENEQKGLKVNHLLKGIEYLLTISLIYQKSTRNLSEDNESYKKLTPIIDKKTLVNQFSKLYQLDIKIAESIINSFVLTKGTDYDIFSQPLISVGRDKIVFCPALIIQMNIVRTIEKITKDWKGKDISIKGLNFEKNIRFHLSDNPNIKVNTNKIEFMAYDERDVEFDLIAKFEDKILLIEFKHLKRPYSDSMLNNVLKTLDKGIEQVNRREDVVINNWNLIKEKCSFELPDDPPEKDNILKLVCTNVFEFTSLVRYGTRIIDSSSLLRFFKSPEINMYTNGEEVNEYQYKHLWKKGAPTVEEFISFLKKPIAIKNFIDSYEETFKSIERCNKEDYNIRYFNYDLFKDPYEEIGKEFSEFNQTVKVKKIGRNEPCPCKSGKKYKKCCGK